MIDIPSFILGATSGGSEIILPSDFKQVSYMRHESACILANKPASMVIEIKGKYLGGDEVSGICGYRSRNILYNTGDFIIQRTADGYIQSASAGTSTTVTTPTAFPSETEFLIYNLCDSTSTTFYIGSGGYYQGAIILPWDGDIYYIAGYDYGSEQSCLFIPCYRKSDNKPGYYEVISDMFYDTLIASEGGKITPVR